MTVRCFALNKTGIFTTRNLNFWPDACNGIVHVLHHWGRVAHIYVSKLSIIGSDNGLSPGRRQAIINIVNLTPRNKLQWNFNRNSYIFIQENPFQNVVWKMAAICLGLNLLNSLWPGDSYMRQWTGSSLVQVMACRQPGDKPLSEYVYDCYIIAQQYLQHRETYWSRDRWADFKRVKATGVFGPVWSDQNQIEIEILLLKPESCKQTII